MDVCVVYISVFGNGKKCVEELISQLKAKGHTARECSIQEYSPDSLPTSDIYVVSAPTRMGKPLGKMKRFLTKLKPKNENARYALMSTGGDEERAPLQSMAAIVEKSGLTKAADGIRIVVKGMKGPLEDGYKEKIKEFAERLVTE